VYLRGEMTDGADESDHTVCREWLESEGLAERLDAAERWVAAISAARQDPGAAGIGGHSAVRSAFHGRGAGRPLVLGARLARARPGQKHWIFHPSQE
jgi:hypothetical protein